MMNRLPSSVFFMLMSSLATLVITADTHISALNKANSELAATDLAKAQLAAHQQAQQQMFQQQSHQGVEQQALPLPQANGDLKSQQIISNLNYANSQSLPTKRYAPRFFGKRSDDLDSVNYIAFETRGAPMFLTAKDLNNNFDSHTIETRGSPRFFGKRYTPRFFGKKNSDAAISLETRGSPRFFGKRLSDIGEEALEVDSRGSPRFFGKRFDESSGPNSPHHLAKRAAPRFFGKRGAPRFVGKRFILRRNRNNFSLTRPFLSAKEFKETYRRSDPYFIGKRASELGEAVTQGVEDSDDDVWVKRGIPRFVGKRGIPRFIGKKRGIPRFIGKKRFSAPRFVGRRSSADGEVELQSDMEPFQEDEVEKESDSSSSEEDLSYVHLLNSLARYIENQKLSSEKEYLE